MTNHKGQIALVYSLFGLFITAIIAMALMAPFGQQTGITLNESNVARAPGATAILQANITMWVATLVVILLGGMGAFAYVKRG